MSVAPYPPPPPATGPVDNPGRQPSVTQAVGLLAGVALLIVIALAAASGDALLTVVAIITAALGFSLGWIARRSRRRPPAY